MSCPECGGFVCFETKILAVEKERGIGPGLWIYHPAYCEDCDWTGIGRQWYEIYNDGNKYEDDVELPKDNGNDILVRTQQE